MHVTQPDMPVPPRLIRIDQDGVRYDLAMLPDGEPEAGLPPAWALRQMVRTLRAGDRVIDVGAGIGACAIHLACAATVQVVAIEADAALRAILDANIRRNCLSDRVSLGPPRPDVLESAEPVHLIRHAGSSPPAVLMRTSQALIARDRPALCAEVQDEASALDLESWARAEGYWCAEVRETESIRLFLPLERLAPDDLPEALAAQRRMIAEQTREMDALRAEAMRLETLVASGQAELADLIRCRDQLLAAAGSDLARTQMELSKLRKYATRLEALHLSMLESTSWRILEPARRLSRLLTGRRTPEPFVPRLGDRPTRPTLEGSALAALGDTVRTNGLTLSAPPLLLATDETLKRSERVTVFLATYPARRDNLAKIVSALMPQCDVLNVYLNEYDRVPECLQGAGIVAILGTEAAGNIRDNGKFYNTRDYEDGYHVFIDDDILYPTDYVATIKAGIARFGFRAIVGFHGTCYKQPLQSYVRDRTVLPFYAASQSALVDQLGTGTAGYHTSTFAIDRAAFETDGIADLWFAKQAAECSVPLVALDRPADWLLGMPETDDTLFRRTTRDDSQESTLLRDRLVPALRDGPRAATARFIRSLYAPAHLERQAFNLDLSLSNPFEPSPASAAGIHFALIITGWNCVGYVQRCLASIERQVIGTYTLDIHAYDDASDDGTWEALSEMAEVLRLRKYRGTTNLGPAFARDFLLRQVKDRQTVCVLLDMDDELLPPALSALERIYRENTECWMTYGNWINQHGEVNNEGLYTAAEIDGRSYRSQETFRFTHLRSFRRFLYDKVLPVHLKDETGAWLRHCSDVGLLLPIADQCTSKNVVALERPMYLYNQHRLTGTQKRFGAQKKVTAAYLRNNFRLDQAYGSVTGPPGAILCPKI